MSEITTRELLLVAQRHVAIGQLAVSEFAAWQERNSKRGALRKWLREYYSATGEWFIDHPEERRNCEQEDLFAYDALRDAAKAAQKRLAAARTQTRRAIRALKEST